VREPAAFTETEQENVVAQLGVPQNSTVRFAVQYDPPGMWMFHCHILEHAELGMMGDLMVMETQ
jgi:FtsP/CotA-like multicopper oxidase with cupredoxin domain